MSPELLAAIDGTRAILRRVQRLSEHERAIYFSALQSDLATRMQTALDIGPPTEPHIDPRLEQ